VIIKIGLLFSLFLVFCPDVLAEIQNTRMNNGTPESAQRVYRFDFGPERSKVWSKQFTGVTPRDVYSKDKGYGLIVDEIPDSGNCNNLLDPLRSDFIGGVGEAYFRLDISPGTYYVYLIAGNYWLTCYSPEMMNLSINGTPVFENFMNWFVPQRYVVNVTNALTLEMSGNWYLNALLVAPVDERETFDTELDELEQTLKAQTLTHYNPTPHQPEGAFHKFTDKEKALGFSVFQRDYMELIWPNESPRPQEPTTSLHIKLAQNETEPCAFGMHAINPIKSLEVYFDAPAALDYDLWQVVSLERRRGPWKIKQKPGEPVSLSYVPDRPTYLGATTIVNLPQGRTQGYWLNIKTRKDTKPGQYNGTIRFVSEGWEIYRLPVSVTVRPFVLQPAKGITYETWYKPYWGHRVGGNEANYKDLTEHGINSTYISTIPEIDMINEEPYVDFTEIDQEIEEARRYGLANGLVFRFTIKKMADNLPGEPLSEENLFYLKRVVEKMHRHAREANWPQPLQFHFVDEPYEGAPERTELAYRWYSIMTPFFESLEGPPRFLTWCTPMFTSSEEYRKFAPLVNVHACHVGKINEERIQIIREAGAEFSYYSNWKYPSVAPRIDAGLYLWRTGATRMNIVSYQYVTGDPFDDFSNSTVDWTYTMTYPTSDAIYPNFAWECFRQGVEDMRYVKALEVALASASGDVEAKKEARAFLDKLQRKISLTEKENWKSGLWTVEEYDKFRDRCFELTVALDGL
jgi:hypothetical protein